MQPTSWRPCSSCKKPLNFNSKFYECSVSTCTGKRTGYAFCSVPCWEAHLPGARHRDAWAVEKQAPSLQVYLAELASEGVAGGASVSGGSSGGASAGSSAPSSSVASTTSAASSALAPPANSSAPVRRIIASTPASSAAAKSSVPLEVLVVVSKMKQYIKDRADMNTSGDVSDILSEIIRAACDDAIDQARADGRKTVMARDFKK